MKRCRRNRSWASHLQGVLALGLALAAWTGCSYAGGVSASRTNLVVTIPEWDCEHRMVAAQRPVYPFDALRHRRQGFVISAVHSDSSGETVDVKVLDATDASFAAAAVDALWRSRLPPVSPDGVPVESVGKVTWYFVIRGSNGLALLPQNVGYIELHARTR
jgi:hypothetical protein